MANWSPEVGVLLPSIGETGDKLPDIGAAARHAEDIGLDSVWAGDHLAVGDAPCLDSTQTLATAAAVTERAGIGFAVLLPALRPFAWTARQVASLQYLAGGRLRLGVGLGGQDAEWHAAGIPAATRGRRTDDFLRQLPGLLAGQSTPVPEVPGRPRVTLTPAVQIPPVWVGGFAPAALRRAARYGDGWLGALQEPEEFAATGSRIAELAAGYGRPTPRTATVVHVALAPAGQTEQLHESYARWLASSYGMDREQADRLAVTGDPEQVAERLAEYVAAGAQKLLLTTPVGNWHRSAELWARSRELLLTHFHS